MRDVAECTTEAIEDEVVLVCVCIGAATGRLMVLLAELDRRQAWGKSGALSLAHWLSWRTGLGMNAAREHVRVARALTGLPEMAEALSRGEISFSKARALTRIAKPESEGQLLAWAKQSSTGAIERRVRRLRRPTAADARRVEERRSLGVLWGEDGMLVIRGRLTPEQGALFLRALEQGRNDNFARRRAPIAAAHERADALARMADKSLSVQAGRSPGDRTMVVVHVDAEVLADPRAEGRCETGDGVGVSGETCRRLACDAAIVRMTHGAQPANVNVGRKSRSVPTALRRALADHQDGKCCFPACSNPIHDDHHGVHWADGGPTDFENVGGLCGRHHFLCHEGGHTMRQVDGRKVFFRPDGTRVEPAPTPPPPNPAYFMDLTSRQLSDDLDAWSLAT